MSAPGQALSPSQDGVRDEPRTSQKAINPVDESQEANMEFDHEDAVQISAEAPSDFDPSVNRKRKRVDWKDYRIPRQYQDGANASSSSSDSSSDTSVSSSSDSSSDSSSESDSNSSDSSAEERTAKKSKKKHAKKPKSKRKSHKVSRHARSKMADNYTRFSLTTEKTSHKIDSELLNYAHKMFSNYEKDSTLQDSILTDLPVPEGFTVQSVDDEWQDMLEDRKNSHVKATESALKRVQARILNVMGPLTKIWTTMEGVRKNGGEKLDAQEFLSLVEKCVCLLGQANVVTVHHRRLNILARIMKNQKKASKFLLKNKKHLSGKHLFGKSFYNKMAKVSKDKQKRKNIEKQFGSTGLFRNNRDFKQPFRHRPSFKKSSSNGGPVPGGSYEYQSPLDFSSNRGRGRGYGGNRGHGGIRGKQNSGHRGGHTTGQQTKRYVEFTFSASSFTTNAKTPSSPNHTISPEGHTGETFGGTHSIFPTQLGTHHKRCNNTANCSRVHNTVHTRTVTKPTSKTIKNVSPGPSGHDRRSDKNAQNSSSKVSTNSTQSVSKHNLCDRKKVGGTQASIQCKTTQQTCRIPAFQNGRNCDSDRDVTSQRLHGETGSQGCVLLCTSSSKPPQVSLLSMGKQNLSVPMLTFRPVVSTQNFHKTTQADSVLTQASRYQSINISGRLDHSKSKPTIPDHRQKFSNRSVTKIRVCNQLEKVGTGPKSKLGILRVQGQLPGDDPVPAPRQGEQNHHQMQGIDGSITHISSQPVQTDRHANSVHHGNLTSSPTLQETANAQNASLATREQLRHSDRDLSGLQERNEMVDRSSDRLEREVIYQSNPRPNDHNRRILIRMGGSLSAQEHRGSMEPNGTVQSHQCTRDESRPASVTDFRDEREATRPPTNGQQNSSSLHQQERGNKIPCPDPTSPTDLASLSGQTNHADSRVPPRQGQLTGRLGVETFHRLQQLDATEICVPTIEQNVGSPPNRSFRRQTESSSQQVCQLATRPLLMPRGCVLNPMGEDESLCLPSILPDRTMPSKNKERRVVCGLNSANLAEPTLVPSSDEHASGRTNSASDKSTSPVVPERRNSSSASTKQSNPCGLENLRNRYQTEGISESAAVLLSKSRRSGTRSAYNSSWKKWSSWCTEREVDSLQATLADVINFLSDMYDQGYSYNTLNGYRSAISKIHPHIQGLPVGQCEAVKDTMVAIFNERPPTPKYTDTWDVNLVLDHIVQLGPNNLLPDGTLSHKVAMLLALTNASRASELHHIDPTYLQDKGDIIEIVLVKPSKTRKAGSQADKLTLHPYETEELDPILALRSYLLRTRHWRTTDARKHQLFLGCTAPHNPVVTCTVSNWLKKLMSAANIDVTKFQAHSTRAAATSKAKAQGMSTDEIVKCANWSNVTTFRRFYDKQVTGHTSTFATSVLNR